jgi:hypothetical protein
MFSLKKTPNRYSQLRPSGFVADLNVGHRQTCIVRF